jgi:DNA invertase Pin-like site-specific DNA recombinase
MTAAIYARFSTDKQSEASIADQFRVCEARAAADGLIVTARHGDNGVSGSTPVAQRPGGRALLADALAGRITVLLIESLDRISRDQVELERTVRRLEHRGIRIIGVSDGYDSAAASRKVVRAVRGIVAELYLDDLRAKTHRGLAGKAAAGYSAGGRSYGYRSEHDGRGYRLAIEPAEAEWVRWIFARYVDGWSVQRIAHELNAQRVPAPRSGSWAASCIYGSAKQGAGLLNNELYIGRMIWNRRQWVKDPDTGRRQKLDRPRSEWQVHEAPELRIVDDELWQAARARMATPRRVGGGSGKGAPGRTLFGGLLKCGVCGGAVTATSARHYGCVARKDRGPTVCAGVVAPRQATDRRLLAMVRQDLLGPEALAELQRAVAEHAAGRATAERQVERTRRARMSELDAEIENLVRTVAGGVNSPALIQALQRAEAERAMLESSTSAIAPPAPEISAGAVVAAYRRKLLELEHVLEADRERARRLLAEIIGRISIVQEGERVFADVEAEAPARLLVAGASLGMVAGAGFRTRRLTII